MSDGEDDWITLVYMAASGGSRNGPRGAKEQGEQKILLGRHSILVDIT
jgi:hypothetical protein